MSDQVSTIPVEQLDSVVIRFAGDSGDGMQLTGDRFASASAMFGNDLATLPNFPAEIRAPQGTLPGVSAFQIQISDWDISTPGDAPAVLVAMNPAALKANLGDVVMGGAVLVNTDTFNDRNLEKAGYSTNPLTDGTLEGFRVFEIPMTQLTKDATAPLGVKPRDAERSKNFFALGVISWMYSRPIEPTETWVQAKFAGKDLVLEANLAAFRAGLSFGETAELFDHVYEIRPATLPPGEYRNVTGNTALALGLLAAANRANLPLLLATYPITPASDILHELSKDKRFGVRTVQAEDEIAAAGIALGAAFGGHLGVTTTSGPGVALKSETISLALSLELPMVIVDVQRGGPSTGLPTKTEQSDLFLAMYGRHGEAPLPVVAAYSATQCFDAAVEACRIALKYRTPVILLSDGYLANGSEPWLIPDVEKLPDISVEFTTQPNGVDDDGNPIFLPFLRDPDTLARPWAVPGTKGLAHRIGGLEKADKTGNVSYDPLNHELMTELRAAKVAGIGSDIAPVSVTGPDDAATIVVGWGSTWGSIKEACRRMNAAGTPIAHAHLTHLAPFADNLGEVLAGYDTVIVPELNLGQLCHVLRAEFLVDAKSVTKVQGLPFTAAELVERFSVIMKEA